MSQRRLLSPMPEAITRSQRDASNPRGSVWVTANAGSGKTYVLTARVLRLLLSGVRPEEILCLTYTKAAAAEMRSRVGARLGEWALMGESELARDIEALTGQQQRILHRGLLLISVVRAEALTLPVQREAVADLLADVVAAARAIGEVVQQHASRHGVTTGG